MTATAMPSMKSQSRQRLNHIRANRVFTVQETAQLELVLAGSKTQARHEGNQRALLNADSFKRQ